MSESNAVMLRFTQSAEQSVGIIKRVTGFVRIRDLVPLLSGVNLDSNPRSAKVGSITSDIGSSLDETPDAFGVKTKGLLVGACSYRDRERRRYELFFEEPAIEGILDGGHNALAIGIHILRSSGVGEQEVKSVRLWEDFKEVWAASIELVEAARRDEDLVDLDIQVPVELIVPMDPSDPQAVDEFRTSLLEICAARNNNAQLKAETKANQEGYFDALRESLPDAISSVVEWKTNDGGRVKVADLVALSWIPLSLLDLPTDGAGRPVERPVPQNIYRGKGDCVVRFERLMSSDKITAAVDGRGPRRQLISGSVRSAFKITADLVDLHEQIYKALPSAYNNAGGSFGRITAVKAKNKPRSRRVTKFTGEPVDTLIPDGFVIPLVYGLQALMEIDVETGEVGWQVEPFQFLEDNFGEVVARYKSVMTLLDWDPQKVGKSPEAYEMTKTAYEMRRLLASV